MKVIKINNLIPKRFEAEKPDEVSPQVEKIIKQVQQKGDTALRQLTKRFDNIDVREFEVNKAELKSAYRKVPKEIITSLNKSIKRISAFAGKQLGQIRSFEYRTKEGIVGQRVIPLDRIGVYVPGGMYPLPSSALMGIIPAKIAGVKEIIVCNPKAHPVTIVAADLAGANRVFKVGGAQAIAAMAYGTETIPKVDKIVGPGNRYVTAAKYIISKDCGIDMLAGPSEIMIIADSTANPKWIAADLIAQAEHDVHARIYCLTVSKKHIPVIQKELDRQSNQQPNKKIILKVLENSSIVLSDNIEQCVNVANLIAPEHLALHIKNPSRLIKQLKNYGTLLVGSRSAVAFGDYVTGSNHILPTNGTARYNGGLGILNFIKCTTYQVVTPAGIKYYTKTASPLACSEGLYGHLQSMAIRV